MDLGVEQFNHEHDMSQVKKSVIIVVVFEINIIRRS